MNADQKPENYRNVYVFNRSPWGPILVVVLLLIAGVIGYILGRNNSFQIINLGTVPGVGGGPGVITSPTSIPSPTLVPSPTTIASPSPTSSGPQIIYVTPTVMPAVSATPTP